MAGIHVDRVKRLAKRIEKELKREGKHIVHTHILEELAKKAGFSNYRAYLVYL
jgi:2-phosphoglycerate kinase